MLTACNAADAPSPNADAPAGTSANLKVDLAAQETRTPARALLARQQALSPAPGYSCGFPRHHDYSSNFILPDHRTRLQLDNDVIRAYEDWKAAYLVEVPETSTGLPGFRVAFSASAPERTVSEGLGFGMLIMVAMAGYDPLAQHYFDGLWRFSRDHPSSIDSRLTAWQIPESTAGEASAFDGDADIALALLMADRQWGSGGVVDYRSESQQMADALYESAIGPQSLLPMLGDWVDPDGAPHNQYSSRSSDFMPASFRAFATLDGAEKWLDVIVTVQEVIRQFQQAYDSGLLPDFVQRDGETFKPADAGFLEGEHDGDYFYNAGRLPWRLAMDALTNGDQQSRESLRNMTRFIVAAVADDPASMGAGYLLDGTPIGNYFSSFFAAPFALALMSEPRYQAQLNKLYDAIYQRREGYYEDSVTLLSLLLLTGNFWSVSGEC